MGLYARWVLPRVLDWAMHSDELDRYRRPVLAPATGRVLEIGFGTGANLRHYPPGLSRLETLDPDPALVSLARRRIEAAGWQGPGRELVTHALSAESLPFAAGEFDTVVSTFTLCSIPDVARALREVRRVLRPGGQFLFLEHGRAPDPALARWQDRLTPLQRRLGGGCHLNRPIARLIREAGLDLQELDERYAARLPRLVGFLSSGRACA